MDEQLDTPDWLIPILQKRSLDALRILADLVEAGLRKGECSANDIRDIKLEQPNIIGACFKILKKLGFENSGRRIKTTAKRKHSRRVDVYVLAQPAKAREFKHAAQAVIVSKAETTQMEMQI